MCVRVCACEFKRTWKGDRKGGSEGGKKGRGREGVREGQRERNFVNVTFVAPRREHFRISLAIFLLLHSLKKRSV